MLVWIAPLIFAAVVAGRLFVRSRMPDKGWFVDSSRADTYMSVLVYFLDHPYANWSGSIKPVEMERSLATIEEGHRTPCDERGNPPPDM